MEDYRLIFEEYQKVTEAGFSYARTSGADGQPKKQLAKFKRPKNDLKNSTSYSTASLPTGSGAKINVANIGAATGGIPEQEETNFKGSPRYVPVKEVHQMFQRMMKEVHTLYKQGNYKQMESKLEMMAMLSRNM